MWHLGYKTSDISETKWWTLRFRDITGFVPKLLHSVYRNSHVAFRLVTNLVTRANLGLLFRGAKFFHNDLTHFLSECEQIWQLGGSGQVKLIPKFRELWSGGSMIPCGNMHQSFTDALVKLFFDNFPMFADSFSVLSIHCIAQGLDACFLYKCPVLCGCSLQQYLYC